MLDFINKEFGKYMVTVYCIVYKHTIKVKGCIYYIFNHVFTQLTSTK